MSDVSDSKQRAVAAIVTQMAANDINLADIKEALQRQGAITTKGDIAVRVFSILGGILVFAGLCAFIAMYWENMNSAMRIIITLGSGLALYAIALAWMREGAPGYGTGAFFLVAISLQTTGWFVLLYELFGRTVDGQYAALFVFALMAIQQAATFLKYRLTLILFFALAFAYSATFSALSIMGAKENISVVLIGCSMMAIAYHLHSGPHHRLSGIGYFLGACGFYAGLFDMFEATMFEFLYFAVVIGMIYVSTVVRSGALLTVTTLSMLCYICYFTAKHFMNSGAWPLVLMVLGGIFFGVSRMAWNIKKKYIA